MHIIIYLQIYWLLSTTGILKWFQMVEYQTSEQEVYQTRENAVNTLQLLCESVVLTGGAVSLTSSIILFLVSLKLQCESVMLLYLHTCVQSYVHLYMHMHTNINKTPSGVCVEGQQIQHNRVLKLQEDQQLDMVSSWILTTC